MVILTMPEKDKLYSMILNGISELEKIEGDEKGTKPVVKFEERIRAYRARHNLTKQQLARRLGVSHNQIYRWESGQHTPGKMAIRLLIEEGIINRYDVG